MCGRSTQKYTWRELVELYRLTQPARNLEPSYNVAPITTIDTFRVRDGARELAPMRWGLVPSWWKKTLKDVPASRIPSFFEVPRNKRIKMAGHRIRLSPLSNSSTDCAS